jgi:hypothetical protein
MLLADTSYHSGLSPFFYALRKLILCSL